MSIQANELRIGNLVDWNGENGIISQLLEREVVFKCGESDLYETINPIPLTEEWLLNFGFKVNRETKEGNNIWRYNWTEGHFEIEQIYSFFLNDNNGYDTEIKYVHQLQNLFFALTIEELNKK
jgi:hypothetical protein